MSTLFDTNSFKVANTILKYCPKCNSKTHHECVRAWLKAKGRYRICRKCLDCKREQQRRQYKQSEQRRDKVKEATNKYLQNEENRERCRQRQRHYHDKQRVIREQEKPIKAAQKLEQSIGATSTIYFIDCSQCGCKKVLKKPYRDGTICGYCYISRISANPVKRTVTCKECGKGYVGNAKREYCYDCKAQKDKELRRINRDKRKAAERYATIAEPVDRVKVFNRDKWKCRMCGVKVQAKRPNDDNAAQLDHIVPLSKGGVHTYSNVQCLCRKCNCVVKTDKYIGQIALQL